MSAIPTQWTNDGFIQRYEELIKEKPTYTAAYLACEEEHQRLFGHYRYSSYDSFRTTRRDRIVKK